MRNFLIVAHRPPNRGEQMTRKNRTLAGPVQFVGAGADITFQRGTTANNSVAIWEDWRQFIGSNRC